MNKQINVMVPKVIDIEDISLLSPEDYHKYKDNIKPARMSMYAYSMDERNLAWWLLPKDEETLAGVYINIDDKHDRRVIHEKYSENVHPFDVHGIRPVIYAKDSDLEVSTQITYYGDSWTVIGPNLILCDIVIGTSPFCQFTMKHLKRPYNYKMSLLREHVDGYYCDMIKKGGQ